MTIVTTGVIPAPAPVRRIPAGAIAGCGPG